MGFKLEEDKDNAGIFQIAGFDKDWKSTFPSVRKSLKKLLQSMA